MSSNILCVPEVMLRDEKDRFLDDVTAKQLGEALGCEIAVIPTDGAGPFGNITDARLGKMLDKEKNTGTPQRYLRNINVRWFNFDLSDLLEMRIGLDEIEKYSIQ